MHQQTNVYRLTKNIQIGNYSFILFAFFFFLI